MQGNFKLYGLFVGLTVTIMITCDTLVYKVFDIYSFKITASGIVFSLCFLISTLLTEVYGYKLSVRAVWIMVLCQTLYVLILNISSVIQSNNNVIASNYYSLFHEFWRVMIGTWMSVPVSYFVNGFIISKMKIIFSGKYFFVRYIIGSMTTQAALLLTAYPISLSGKYTAIELVNIISTTWSYKVVVSIILLPLAIFLVGIVKKVERTDHYDWGTSYNPFK
ncbi:VUT family protein [Serratia liquefaciens]|uniref:VUT family protein n=1 Tax=Serratia liquefaciens TaxID=614 RepID=UPI0022B9FC55|nr:VUT family protein [Serratia liquefaciens]